MISSYKELTINKYLELQELLNEEMDDLALQVRLIAVLSGVSEDEILDLPLDEYQKLVAKTSFLTEKPKTSKNVPNKIVIGGKKYTICKSVPNMNVAQYIDYHSWSSHNEQDKHISNILACFIIPEGHKYGDGYDLGEVTDSIANNMSIEDAIAVCFFFHNKYRRTIEDMLIYLDWKIRRMKRKVKDKTTMTKLKEATDQVTLLRDSLQSGLG